jgi:hypothetical protein
VTRLCSIRLRARDRRRSRLTAASVHRPRDLAGWRGRYLQGGRSRRSPQGVLEEHDRPSPDQAASPCRVNRPECTCISVKSAQYPSSGKVGSISRRRHSYSRSNTEPPTGCERVYRSHRKIIFPGRAGRRVPRPRPVDAHCRRTLWRSLALGRDSRRSPILRGFLLAHGRTRIRTRFCPAGYREGRGGEGYAAEVRPHNRQPPGVLIESLRPDRVGITRVGVSTGQLTGMAFRPAGLQGFASAPPRRPALGPGPGRVGDGAAEADTRLAPVVRQLGEHVGEPGTVRDAPADSPRGLKISTRAARRLHRSCTRRR